MILTTPPPFNWLPPVWDSTKPDLKTDPGSKPYLQSAAPTFNDPDKPPSPGGHPKLNGATDIGNIDMDARVTTLKANTAHNKTHFVAKRDVEDPEESDGALTEVPHPRSDFRHVDPGFDSAPFLKAVADLRTLKGPATKDGEADSALKKALPALENLEAMMTPTIKTSKGMKRLKLMSDNTLVRIITLLGEINVALKQPLNTGKAAYNAARDEYIEMLMDLDDREPNTVLPGGKGYGRVVQWFYVRPIIHDADGQIKGAVVQAKWNPHMSSSGIPIPHA